MDNPTVNAGWSTTPVFVAPEPDVEPPGSNRASVDNSTLVAGTVTLHAEYPVIILSTGVAPCTASNTSAGSAPVNVSLTSSNISLIVVAPHAIIAGPISLVGPIVPKDIIFSS